MKYCIGIEIPENPFIEKKDAGEFFKSTWMQFIYIETAVVFNIDVIRFR